MIETFKKGGKVSKRIAWEIILGVKEIALKEKSLVEVVVPEGVTCDIVGDSESQPCICHMVILTGSAWSELDRLMSERTS